MKSAEIHELLCSTLKLDTLPVAVSLVEKTADLVEKPVPMKLNNCQLISMARHGGAYSSGIAS